MRRLLIAFGSPMEKTLSWSGPVESDLTATYICICNLYLLQQFLEDKVRPLWPKGWMQKGY